MLFHTWAFLIFFLFVYGVFLALQKTPFRLHWLLVASYFFYAWWNPLYLLLIVYSTLLDFYVVILMERSSRKLFWLGSQQKMDSFAKIHKRKIDIGHPKMADEGNENSELVAIVGTCL